MEVVVIGAGIIGCAVAYNLAEAGCSVQVIESGEVGGRATRASFSWLNSNSKEPRSYHDLNVAGMQEHRRFAADSQNAAWFHPSGNFEWTATNHEEAQLEAKVSRLRDWGYAAEWVTVQELQRSEPDVSPGRQSKKIAHYPEEAWIDACQLSLVLLRHAEISGATIHTGRKVVSMDVNRNRIRSVVTNTGERFHGDVIVVCAGSATGTIVSFAHATLPMRNRAGVIVFTAPVRLGLAGIVHAPTVSIRPAEEGRVLLHSRLFELSRTAALSDFDAVDLSRRIFTAAGEIVPALKETRIAYTRVGVRPIPHDGLPAVGFLPGLENLYVAVSHSGVTLALILGQLIGREIGSCRPHAGLEEFRPERFAE